jgi:hypothetical protein
LIGQSNLFGLNSHDNRIVFKKRSSSVTATFSPACRALTDIAIPAFPVPMTMRS